jgi:hypothetical protein
MPALLLVSPEPLAGKTTVAVGLAHGLRNQTARLSRLPGGGHAEADSALFASLAPASSEVVHIIESAAGDPRGAVEANNCARVLVVVVGSQPL